MSDLNPLLALAISLGIIASSAFFVAIEFALVAARKYRLSEAAQASFSARAALRSARDLSLLLAGSQLGITLCVVALGAITKPAVHHLLVPVLETVGAPYIVADVAAFVLALVLVTFLHLVVGEMAPKSWAISHPEKSAIVLAIPMRMFMALTRPLLIALNGTANWCLKRFGVEQVDEVAGGHGPDDLRELVEHSAKAGALDEEQRDRLATALAVNTRPLSEVCTPKEQLATVPPRARIDTVRSAARKSGHLRLVVREAGRLLGVVHVRDFLAGAPDVTAARLMRPVVKLDGSTPIYRALSMMRESRVHLAIVESAGTLLGLVTLQDLLDELLLTSGSTS